MRTCTGGMKGVLVNRSPAIIITSFFPTGINNNVGLFPYIVKYEIRISNGQKEDTYHVIHVQLYGSNGTSKMRKISFHERDIGYVAYDVSNV